MARAAAREPGDRLGANPRNYSVLFRNFALLSLVFSVVPLLAVGWILYANYEKFATSKMMLSFERQVENHRQIIELFLKERRAKLQLIAQTQSLEFLSDMSNLKSIFEMLNADGFSFTDLGVIDDQGRHLAYIGPYDLMDKNYSKTPWFKEVMQKNIYISDMFMGFRKEPHFIIAVIGPVEGRKWILRATIDTEVFRSLVENVHIGKTGEVYLANPQGILQTSPRFSGKIMGPAPLPVEPAHVGIKVRLLKGESDGGRKSLGSQIVGQAWLKEPKWLLVVRQSRSEAFSELKDALHVSLIFLALSAFTVLILAIYITRYMIKIIKRRDRQSDELNEQLMQAGKLASIGELSAGVAHEINNPLAIILTERQIMMDLSEDRPLEDQEFREQFLDSMNQIDVQVQRCKRITQNLLRFARRTRSVIETVDLRLFINEIVELMEREAKASGIKFFTEIETDLPPLLSDPSQLQQVFLNLITNSIDAHEDKPYGSVRVTARSVDQQGVRVTFADTGSGIAPENLSRIFDPFFTTKAVGKGTGLGLSICYSIIKRLGGEISVKSELTKGTEFTLFLPFAPPAELLESVEGGQKD